MKQFTIEANSFLQNSTNGFFHTHFYGSQHPQNPNFLYQLKYDPHHNWNSSMLFNASKEFSRILSIDLPQIQNNNLYSSMAVCVVPRAKAKSYYSANQMLFRAGVKNMLKMMTGFDDGTDFIIRHTNTKTTHLRRPDNRFNNDGSLPYPGITKDTCHISPKIQGKDILLIDDIYTKTVNIDEDVIQALYDAGANSVMFYAIAKTISKY